MKIRNYLLAFVLGSTLAFAKDINFDVVGEVFDYGPQTTKIILKFDEQINPKTLDTQTFKVLTQDLKDRNITTIDFIDHNNVSLNLEHGQNIKDANLLYWDDQKFSNVVIPTNYTLIQTKDMTLENGKTIKKDTYKYYMKSLKIKDVDKFTAGEMYGLKYRDFKPQKDGNKHPLIIWLHGAGEGGDSNITQILGNRGGVAFVEEDAQKYLILLMS